jgi:hypothetical protein
MYLCRTISAFLARVVLHLKFRVLKKVQTRSVQDRIKSKSWSDQNRIKNRSRTDRDAHHRQSQTWLTNLGKKIIFKALFCTIMISFLHFFTTLTDRRFLFSIDKYIPKQNILCQDKKNLFSAHVHDSYYQT